MLVTMGAVQAAITGEYTVQQNQTATYGYEDIGINTEEYGTPNYTPGNLINRGQVNAQQININAGNLINYGTVFDLDETDIMDGDLLAINDNSGQSYIDNYGRIEGYVRISYGALYMREGSYAQAVDVSSYGEKPSRLVVEGDVKVDYLYLDENVEVTMTLGSSVDFSGGKFEFYDAKVVVLVEEALANGDTTTDFSYLQVDDLFVNFVNDTWGENGGWGAGAGFTEDTLITLRDGENNEVVRPYSQLHTVPEPTTATLSLLALAGLAMRRKRR
ncbi:MAG: PEP-CTERM sorting domain-containing protein [Akkermansia sp.]|nr:PEP-CTERM sorting domain-containing protein [Akkermansia sp.]